LRNLLTNRARHANGTFKAGTVARIRGVWPAARPVQGEYTSQCWNLASPGSVAKHVAVSVRS